MSIKYDARAIEEVKYTFQDDHGMVYHYAKLESLKDKLTLAYRANPDGMLLILSRAEIDTLGKLVHLDMQKVMRAMETHVDAEIAKENFEKYTRDLVNKDSDTEETSVKPLDK